jgi:hypothetical protein
MVMAVHEYEIQVLRHQNMQRFIPARHKREWPS